MDRIWTSSLWSNVLDDTRTRNESTLLWVFIFYQYWFRSEPLGHSTKRIKLYINGRISNDRIYVPVTRNVFGKVHNACFCASPFSFQYYSSFELTFQSSLSWDLNETLHNESSLLYYFREWFGYVNNRKSQLALQFEIYLPAAHYERLFLWLRCFFLFPSFVCILLDANRHLQT